MDRTKLSGRARTNVALAALFFGTFVLGSAQTVEKGILDLVARDMNVSIFSGP